MISQLNIWRKQYADKIWVFADQALVSGVNFSIGILLARWLGLEMYGLFALGWMFVLFASGFQQSFIVAPLYALSAKQKDQKKWISSLHFVQLCFSLVCIPLTIAVIEVSFFFQPEWQIEGISLLIGLLVGVYTLNDFFRRVLFLKAESQKVMLMDLLGYGMQILGLIGVEFAGHLSLYTAVLSILIAQGLSVALYFLVCQPSVRTSDFLETMSSLWKYSRYLVATSVLQWSSGNYFIIVAGTVLGTTAVGAIRIVQNLMGLLHIIFLALENIIPVRAAAILNASGGSALFDYLRKTFIVLILPVISVLGILIFFQEEVIFLFYGELTQDVSHVLMAFAVIYLMVFVGTMFRFAIRTLEMNHLIFKSYVLTTVFSLVFAHLFISKFGEMGVVAGLAGTQLISLTYFFIALKKTFKWKSISYTSY